MKFPSLTSLFQSAGRTFLRFPLAILLAFTATAISIKMVHIRTSEDDVLFTRYWNAIISSYLGMLLSIAVTVWTERKAWTRGRALALQGLVLLLSVLYYFMMPGDIQQKTVIRWVLYALGLHWLIAVIGFTGNRHINGFWQFNKKIFLRILTSMLYTSVLYIGLSLALLAVEKLFNADIAYKWYTDTWLILMGIFNTWFFLAGFPPVHERIGIIDDYPKGLKIFTQYVLLPILTVYMVILYAYLLKIVLTAHWPSGWVAYLVLGFSVTGILALLLIYPLRNDEGNKWINGYSRFFYFALFPLLVLLGFAIWKRVAAYGITELRYFVLVLAAWLLCIAVYFLRSRKKNIQLIPLSLCMIAFLSSFGPGGAFNFSRHSQQARLEGLLEKYGLFADGRVKGAGTGTGAGVKVPFKDRKEISSATEYLVDMHGYQSLQPWFRENLDSMMRKDSLMGKYEVRGRTEAIMKLMHLSYAGRFDDEEPVARFDCEMVLDNLAFPTGGLPYVIPGFDLSAMDGVDTSYISYYKLGDDSLMVYLDSTNRVHFLASAASSGGLRAKDSALIVGLEPILRRLPDTLEYNMRLLPKAMTLPINDARWRGLLLITELSGTKKDRVLNVERIKGYLLIGRKAGH